MSAAAMPKQSGATLLCLTHGQQAPVAAAADCCTAAAPQVRSDVAALVMEEVAPQAVSRAGMQLPSEVFSSKKQGNVVAEGGGHDWDRLLWPGMMPDACLMPFWVLLGSALH